MDKTQQLETTDANAFQITLAILTNIVILFALLTLIVQARSSVKITIALILVLVLVLKMLFVRLLIIMNTVHVLPECTVILLFIVEKYLILVGFFLYICILTYFKNKSFVFHLI